MNALVPPRATLAAVLEAHELLAQEVAAIVGTLGQTFDLRRFRAGQPYRLDRFHDGRLREFEYEIDLDRRAIVRRRGAGGDAAFEAEIAVIPKTVDAIVVEGAISRAAPSLVQAIDAAGERIEYRWRSPTSSPARWISTAICSPATRSASWSSAAPATTAALRDMEPCWRRNTSMLVGHCARSALRPRRQARLLRPRGSIAQAFFLEVTAQVRTAHHLVVFAQPAASHPQLHACAQRRRLRGARGRTRGVGGRRRDYVRRMDGRRRAAVRVRHASGYRGSRPCTCRRLARASEAAPASGKAKWSDASGRPALPPVRTSITA